MDARNSQQPPYHRDRHLVQNPNHQPSPPQPPPYPYPPAASQAPVHVPFDNSHLSRDPFLPQTAQHQRAGSYGVHQSHAPVPKALHERQSSDSAWPTAGHSHHSQHAPYQSGAPHHPPPPPVATSLQQASSISYNAEQNGRRSIGASSPGYSREPPQLSRGMPPPSPQKQAPPTSFGSQRTTPAAYNTAPSLPGIGGSNRPASGFSISSILGGSESSAPPASHAPLQTSPPTAAMQPPSPRRPHSHGSRNDFGHYGRPRTPDRFTPSSRPQDTRSHGAHSPTRSSHSAHGSPTQYRQNYPSLAQPYKPLGHQEPRPNNSTSKPRDQAVPARPNSQPNGPVDHDPENRRRAYDPVANRPLAYGYPQGEQSRMVHESQQPRSAGPELSDRMQQGNGDRDRPVTVHPLTQSAYGPPNDPASHAPRSLFWRNQVPDETRKESREEFSRDPRAPFPASTAHVHPATQGTAMSIERSFSDHGSARLVDSYSATPTSDPLANERRRMEQSAMSGTSSAPPFQPRPIPFVDHNRAYILEANRKTGRASPLPQAVQGVSSQPLGPGDNPNIKNEFGRMFSGLGGGLISAPSRTGTATPGRSSPMPQNGAESLHAGHDYAEHAMMRVNSQSGRKSTKRVKDEDGVIDVDGPDGRLTPSLRGGPKRSKHHHPTHHHHHTGPGHHHHHIHHKHAGDHDESTHSHPAANGQFTTMRLGNNTPNADHLGHATHHHHHHHVVHPAHHHHTPGPRAQPRSPSPKLSKKVIQTDAVLAEALKSPRRHLGSQLYEPQLNLPPASAPLDEKFGFVSISKPLKENVQANVNCTLTIRVSRYYLKARQREQIIRQHLVWGTRIYRDDSDPVAAAIHDGWLCGAWEDVADIGILDDRLRNVKESTNSSEEVNAVPAAPLEPPADMDLHLTLLILPPLQHYYPMTQFGISSRKAGSGHTGMSFVIQKMRWVDEGVGSRGYERTSEARSSRLNAAHALLGLMTSGSHNNMGMNGAAVGA